MIERVFVMHWGLTVVSFFDEVVILSSQFTWHYWWKLIFQMFVILFMSDLKSKNTTQVYTTITLAFECIILWWDSFAFVKSSEQASLFGNIATPSGKPRGAKIASDREKFSAFNRDRGHSYSLKKWFKNLKRIPESSIWLLSKFKCFSRKVLLGEGVLRISSHTLVLSQHPSRLISSKLSIN